MQFRELSQHEEEIGKAIVNAAFKIHKELGPDYLKKYMKYVWLMKYEKRVLM